MSAGLVNWSSLLMGRHVTDACLLALAVKNKGHLVALDKGIPLTAVQGAQAARCNLASD